MTLLISMGIRPSGRPNEPLAPRLREIDAASGRVLRELAWATPGDRRSGPTADQEFTAPSWLDERTLLQPSHTEVLLIDVVLWRVVDVVSHPLFHSVHSAAPTPSGGMVVSSAGNESVIELDAAGGLARHHFLRDVPFAEAYPGVDDFRRCHHDRFKPHTHHPNHAAWVGDDLWVTCFETREARSLTRPGRRLGFDGIPHDGRLRGGLLWFTLVSGQLVAVEPQTLEVRRRIDVAGLDGRPQLPGWCRGIEVVEDRAFVGMTMLRRTRHREVLRSVLLGERGRKLPTRVVELDLREPRIVRELAVGNEAGGTIYGVTYRP